MLPCDNDSVLAFLRRTTTETLLVVANMAATARSATVRLPRHSGWAAHDVFGGAPFPAIAADGTASFTLGSRDFYWLELTAP